MKAWWLCVLTCACAACADEETAVPPAPCDPALESCTLVHDFGGYPVMPAEEVDGICMSWTVENEDDLWLNAIRTDNDGYFHHSNWFFVPEDQFDEPDGAWDCWAKGFSEIDAALAGGVLYAQSTQTKGEEQRFAPGAAVRLPSHARIIAYTHLLNATGEAAETAMRVELDTMPATAVTAELAPFRLNYNDLLIPPKSHAEFEGQCAVRATQEGATDGPFRFNLHYVLPHFHTLGTVFDLEVLGGEHDGESLYHLENAYGDPLGHTFDEPVDLAALGAEGLTFRCGYDNPRDQEVLYGIGDQEMCVMLGFADSGLLFDGLVSETASVGSNDAGVLATGPCSVIGVPFPANF